MLVESLGFTFKSSFSDAGEPPAQFDIMSAFSRSVDISEITTFDHEELKEEFSYGVTMPEWLTLYKVSSPHRLSMDSLSYLVRLEYVIDDRHQAYSMIELERFCNHLLWALSSREAALAVRYITSNKVITYEEE